MTDCDLSEAEQRHLKAILAHFGAEFGTQDEDLRKLMSDLHWARWYRRRVETSTKAAVVAFIVAVVGGTVAALWAGIAHVISLSR